MSARSRTFVILLLLQIASLFASNNIGTTFIKIDRIEPCEDALDAPMVSSSAVIHTTANGHSIVSWNMTAKRNIDGDLEGVWQLERCANKESLDTCQRFKALRARNYCSLLSGQGQSWSIFVDCIHPKLHCPFRKGTYVAKNCRFDLTAFRLFPIGNSFWRARITVQDARTKQVIFCVLTGGGLAKI